MGTRHLIMVVYEGKTRIAQYGQWDGYPEGQGVSVLAFLSKKTNIKNLKKALSKVRFYDENNKKDKEFLDAYEKNAATWSNEPDNRTPEQIHWYNTYISRDLGSEILYNVANSEDDEILLQDSSDFAGDSLFCEYAYVIDLDKNVLEVYNGFNHKSLNEKERFYSVPIDCPKSETPKYYQVTLWQVFDLNSLPTKTQFLHKLRTNEDGKPEEVYDLDSKDTESQQKQHTINSEFDKLMDEDDD